MHSTNASSPMLVNPSGKATEVSPVQKLNADALMLVNLLERSLRSSPCNC